MIEWILLIIGILFIFLVYLDILQTTIEHTGPGFLSSRLGASIWHGFMTLTNRNGRNSILNIAGLFIVSFLLISWIFLLWIGFTLIFSFQTDSIIHSNTEIPASLIEKFYYIGYVLSTLGLGDFKASSDLWRILTVIISISGLLTITLFITYLIPLLSAVTNKRTICSYINMMGENPEQIILKGWNQKDLIMLNHHFNQLTWQILDLKENHLLYPVLHYFHSTEKKFVSPISLSILDETLTIILGSTFLMKKIDTLIIHQLRSALDEYLKILEGTYIYEEAEAPEIPELNKLQSATGIVVNINAIRNYFDEQSSRRKLLNGMIQADGWKWDDIRE